MPPLANWLIQNYSTYEELCTYSVWILISIGLLALGKRNTNDHVFKILAHPVTFISVMALCLVLHRLPFLYITEQLNPDEALALAGAMKFKTDWVPWRSVDYNTTGPFFAWLLNILNLTGMPLNYHTARVAGLLCLTTQWTFTYLSLRLITTEALSRVFTCAGVMFSIYSSHPDWLHYSSEHLPNAVLAGAWYCGVCWIVGRKLRYALISLLLLGLLPWIKIQYAPFTVLLAPVVVAGLIGIKQKNIKNGGYALLALSTPTIIMAVILLSTESFTDFFRSYILANVEYSTESDSTAGPPVFQWLTIPDSLKAFSYPLLVLVLIGITALIVKPQLINIRVRTFFLLFLTGMVATVFCVSGSGKWFLHYLLIVVPVQTIATGLFCGVIVQEFLDSLTVRRRTLAECAFCVVIGFITIWPQHLARNNPNAFRFPWAEQIQITHQSVQGDAELAEKYGHKPMAIWGFRPDIFVALDAVPATRDICTQNAIKPNRLLTYYRARFLSDMKHSAPPLFMDAAAPGSLMFTDREKEGYEIFEDLKNYVAEHYTLVEELVRPGATNGVRIYRLKSLPPLRAN